MNCLGGPKRVSIGLAREAQAGVKHSSALSFFAHTVADIRRWAKPCVRRHVAGSRPGSPCGDAAAPEQAP